mgnify:CR=1 FL=1
MRPRVVITNVSGWPGNSATGPNRSLDAVFIGLRDCFDFTLVAPKGPRRRTSPQTQTQDAAPPIGATTHYTASGPDVIRVLRQLLQPGATDLLWMQSFFAPWFTVVPLLAMQAGILPRIPVLLSVRGELSEQALSMGSPLKRSYLSIARAMSLFRSVSLHATSDLECADIERHDLKARSITSVPDTAGLAPCPTHTPRPPGTPLRLVYLGRIHPMKGLLTALRALHQLRSPSVLDIWGPVQDPEYKNQCEAAIARMPDHVRCEWHGVLDATSVVPTLGSYDLLILPSESENFGHAIFEALSAGTPVLIGDKTPWRHLEEAGVGFDIPLNSIGLLAEKIEQFAALDAEETQLMRRRARAFAEREYLERQSLERTRAMLNATASGLIRV